MALVVLIIFVALAFDYVNGFHDAANSIATVVATRVLSPGAAVAMAAFFNFIAVIVFGTAVAKTVGGDMVDITLIRRRHAALCAACGRDRGDHLESDHVVSWACPPRARTLSWEPTRERQSSAYSHIGGYAAVFSVLKAEGWIKTLTFIVLSPLIGMVLGFFLMVAVYWIFHRVR